MGIVTGGQIPIAMEQASETTIELYRQLIDASVLIINAAVRTKAAISSAGNVPKDRAEGRLFITD